jgi:protein SCO1/2
VAFITVDPDRDLPQVIEPYIASFVKGAHPLRPDSRQQLEPVQHAFGAGSSVSRDSSGIVHVSHTSMSYLVDEHGRVVEEWSFGTTPDAMAADLRVLLGPARY